MFLFFVVVVLLFNLNISFTHIGSVVFILLLFKPENKSMTMIVCSALSAPGHTSNISHDLGGHGIRLCV